jgi:hypothetical protein
MPAMKIKHESGRVRTIWRDEKEQIKVGDIITYGWGEAWKVIEILPPKKHPDEDVRGKSYTWR